MSTGGSFSPLSFSGVSFSVTAVYADPTPTISRSGGASGAGRGDDDEADIHDEDALIASVVIWTISRV